MVTGESMGQVEAIEVDLRKTFLQPSSNDFDLPGAEHLRTRSDFRLVRFPRRMSALERPKATEMFRSVLVKMLRNRLKPSTDFFNFRISDELSDLTGSGSEETFDELDRGMENLEC